MDRISYTCIWVFAFVEGGKWRQYLISHDKSDWYTWFGIHACVSSTKHLNWVHRISLCQWILLQPKLYCWKGWNYLGLHTVRFLEDILLINSVLLSLFTFYFWPRRVLAAARGILIAAHGLSSCGARALVTSWHVGSKFPDQGWNLRLLHWEVDS